MKYIGKTTAGTGKEVYQFFLGEEECTILHGLLSEAVKNTPKLLETQIFRHRMDTMVKEIYSVLKDGKSRK